MTPFLALVVAGFATFMLVLGFVSIRGYLDDMRAASAATPRGKVGAPNPPPSEINMPAVVSAPSPSDERQARATRSQAG